MVFGGASVVLMVACLLLAALLFLSDGATSAPANATPLVGEGEAVSVPSPDDRIAQDRGDAEPPRSSGTPADTDPPATDESLQSASSAGSTAQRPTVPGAQEPSGSNAARSSPVDPEGNGVGGAGETWPLDDAAEPHRERIEAALTLSRGDDPAALRAAIETLTEIRAEIDVEPGDPDRGGSLVLLDHYLAERRSRLALVELRTLLGAGGD